MRWVPRITISGRSIDDGKLGWKLTLAEPLAPIYESLPFRNRLSVSPRPENDEVSGSSDGYSKETDWVNEGRIGASSPCGSVGVVRRVLC